MGRMDRAARKLERREAEQEREFAAEHAGKADPQLAGMEFGENSDELVTPAGHGKPEAAEKQVANLWRKQRLATYFGVHPKTIEKWRKFEGLPCVKGKHTIRFDFSDVSRWVSARKEGV